MHKRKKLRRDLREKDLKKRKATRATSEDDSTEQVTKKSKRVKPLKFLLNVMNDPSMDIYERIKAAHTALPYCHAQKTRKVGKGTKAEEPKSGEGVPASKPKRLGKKETKQVEAQSAASSGRFRPMSPPHSGRINGATH